MFDGELCEWTAPGPILLSNAERAARGACGWAAAGIRGKGAGGPSEGGGTLGRRVYCGGEALLEPASGALGPKRPLGKTNLTLARHHHKPLPPHVCQDIRNLSTVKRRIITNAPTPHVTVHHALSSFMPGFSLSSSNALRDSVSVALDQSCQYLLLWRPRCLFFREFRPFAS